MIDHIAIPKECVDTISDCLILSDDALTVSTHRPVLYSLKFTHAEQTDIRSTDITYPIKWRCVKDAEIGNYRDCLEILSQGLCIRTVSYEGTQIDKICDDIVYDINKATDQCIPRSKGFKQYLKSYWYDTLKHLHKHMKQCRRLWILDGKPSGNDFKIFETTNLLSMSVDGFIAKLQRTF